MAKISFEEEIITLLGPPNKETKSKPELQYHCPFHSDNKESFSINTQTGLWICFTCGKGNLRQLAERLAGQ